MLRNLWEIMFVALSFGFVYFWEQSNLSDYTIQALGIVLFLFILQAALKRKLGFSSFLTGNTLAIVLFSNIVILLLIFATGVYSSPLFFLLYFLSFGVIFVFRPVTVFIFTVGLVLTLLPESLKNDVFRNFIMLGSLALIAPLSLFFGKIDVEKEK